MSTIYARTLSNQVVFKKHVKLNPKQKRFFKSAKKYVAYGGARGGGKSFGLRVKFSLLAMRYPNLRLLLLRRTFPELEANHILPLQRELKGIAIYRASQKAFLFNNGSILKLGYCDNDASALQYQGHEYDVIGFEEATLFSEYVLRFIGTCLRSVRTDFVSRIYYTCNPGGPSHHYIKRLFIDKIYERDEDPDDYEFIPALVWDNTVLMENDPDYMKMLNNMPEDMVAAHRDGDWDALSGAFFKEFKRNIHVIEPFVIPSSWYTYFVMDYGLDCLAGYWIADDHEGNFYVTKEVWEKDHIISSAAKRILEITGDDQVVYWYAPPDMRARQKDTGKTALEIFSDHGINFLTTKTDRVEGWLCLKELLRVRETPDLETGKPIKTAALKIFSNCKMLVSHIPVIQRSEKDPNDVSKEPHELTHALDAIRYFACEYAKPYYETQEHISGTWTRGELKLKGYTNMQIDNFVNQGYIKLLGR
jgi:phage terminase large subunit